MPTDRYIPRMDCGKSVFKFRFAVGDEMLTDYDVALQAQLFNEPADVCSAFPKASEGKGAVSPSAVTVEGKILVSVIGQPGKTSDTGNLTLRLYEPQGKNGKFTVNIPALT